MRGGKRGEETRKEEKLRKSVRWLVARVEVALESWREDNRYKRKDGESREKIERRRTLRLNRHRPLFNIVKMSIRPLSILLLLAIVLDDLISIGRAEKMSGLYVDNGFDQTVVHRVVSQREKRELEHEFLNLLGLPDRPRNTIGRPPQVKRSAPKFLLDIYKNTLDEDEEEKSVAHHHRKAGEFDLTGQDLKAIDQSDVIMTFAARSE